MINYQPVRPGRVFRGELKEGFFAFVPRINGASRSLGVAVFFIGDRAKYISGAS